MASETASDIVDAVGGPQNIASLTHCATRLRFQLVDGDAVDKDRVEAVPGVMGAVPQAGDRFQVVIGGAVQTVYNDIMKLPAMATVGAPSDAEIKAANRARGPRGKVAWLDSLFEFLSDSFRPILGALLGASLFITFMALMATLGVIPAWNAPGVTLEPSWAFVNLMWQCVFVFLPLLVAYNAASKAGADPWVGFAIMAVVMLPGFTALGQTDAAQQITFLGSDITTVTVWGLPLTIFDYSSQVFPPLLMAAVLGPLYKGLKKIIPANLQLLFVPFLAMLVMIPLTAFLLGPLGVYVGAAIANALSAINAFSPLIFAIVIPLAYPFMVPLGLHWPINAIMLLNIQTLGYDFIQGPMGVWNFACFGATAGVLWIAWRERDTQMKQTSSGALAAGLLGGISEPSLYGIHLRFKRIYPRILAGCLVGGVIIGLGGGVRTEAFVFTSLLTIPAFDNVLLYCVSIFAAFFVSMLLVVFTGYKGKAADAVADAAEVAPAPVVAETAPVADATADVAAPAAAPAAEAAAPAATAVATAAEVIELAAPLTGTVVALDAVPDAVFGGGIMGPGVGIEPTGDTVVAPAAGSVVAVQPTGHAYGIELDSGIELLVHVGIDTVEMKGAGFDIKVAMGDRVEAGTPLVVFDRAAIAAAGHPTVTPVIVLNGDDFAAVEPIALGRVEAGQPLLRVRKA